MPPFWLRKSSVEPVSVSGVETVCPVLYQALVTSVRGLTSHQQREECQHCLSYLTSLESLLSSLASLSPLPPLTHSHTHHQEKVTISQADVEKELMARANREENNVVLNDKIICCYICVVVIVILVLVVVIIVMSVMDEQKYKIF